MATQEVTALDERTIRAVRSGRDLVSQEDADIVKGRCEMNFT